MQSRDFAFFLQGFMELNDNKLPTQKQWDLIKKHLDLVFIHEISPSFGDIAHQEKLEQAHDGTTKELDKECLAKAQEEAKTGTQDLTPEQKQDIEGLLKKLQKDYKIKTTTISQEFPRGKTVMIC